MSITRDEHTRSSIVAKNLHQGVQLGIIEVLSGNQEDIFPAQIWQRRLASKNQEIACSDTNYSDNDYNDSRPQGSGSNSLIFHLSTLNGVFLLSFFSSF
jgi:hypothetical protein